MDRNRIELFLLDCEMVGSKDEIVIVNFDETTLSDNKPCLTYTLAEKVSRQVFEIFYLKVKTSELRHAINLSNTDL